MLNNKKAFLLNNKGIKFNFLKNSRGQESAPLPSFLSLFKKEKENIGLSKERENLRLLNSRGQESAPFELLIAVIVMTFVIFVGMNALTKLHDEECDYKIQKSMQDLEFALEKTINQAVPQKLSFYPPNCYKKQTVFLQYKENKNICTDICEIEKERCVILNFFSENGSNHRSCVDISINTLFQQETDGCPADTADGTPIDLQTYNCAGGTSNGTTGKECRSDISSGTYVMKNNTKAGDPFSTICAYKVK